MIFPCRPLARVRGPEKIGRFRRGDAEGEMPKQIGSLRRFSPCRSSHLQTSSRQTPVNHFGLPAPVRDRQQYLFHTPSLLASMNREMLTKSNWHRSWARPGQVLGHVPPFAITHEDAKALSTGQHCVRAGGSCSMPRRGYSGQNLAGRAQTQSTSPLSPLTPPPLRPSLTWMIYRRQIWCYSAETRRVVLCNYSPSPTNTL